MVRARPAVKLMTALGGAAFLGLSSAVLASADMTGGCHAQAVGSRSGSIDLTNASALHLDQDEVLAIRGTAPSDQTWVQLTVYMFGFGIPFPQVGGFKEQNDGQSGIKVSDYSRYARVLVMSATTNTCSGSLLVTVDNLSPVRNAAGAAGAILGLLGLLGIWKAARGKGRIGSRIGGGLSGLIGGTGISLLLQQMLWIDPRNIDGLAPPIAGLVLGIILAGAIRRAPKPAPSEEQSHEDQPAAAPPTDVTPPAPEPLESPA
ncbi:MAG TPA: hypothetical protein VN906_04970 [Candidatus Sulfotelmatobacter sp.]|nr:hypothetical protein [Candidatus Sulfotelmatobacter sp.]